MAGVIERGSTTVRLSEPSDRPRLILLRLYSLLFNHISIAHFYAFISVSLRLRENPPRAISQRSSLLPIHDICVIRGHPPRARSPLANFASLRETPGVTAPESSTASVSVSEVECENCQ
jgi:hypothetical protein